MMTTTGQSPIRRGMMAIAAATSTIALHLHTVAIGLLIGILDGNVVLSVVIGELVLFVASLVIAIVMTVRWRGSAGVGVVVGWFAGAAGLAGATVAVLVACVVFAVAMFGLMFVSFLL